MRRSLRRMFFRPEEQIQLAVRVGLEPGASELQVWHSNHLATLPPLLIAVKSLKSQIRLCCNEKQLQIKACIHALLTNM